MEFQTLSIEKVDEVLYCQLDRPDKRNALNLEMLTELLNLFQNLLTKDSERVLVLRGRGKVFSAGADLSMMSDTSGKDKNEILEEAGLFFDCFNALFRLGLPTICYVHGGVHGGANGLLAGCDFTFADPDTIFSFGEVGLGLIPATVAPFVVHRTGMTTAKQWMLSGAVFGTDVANRCGLIDYIVSKEEADDKIRDLTGRILRNAPSALSNTKNLLHEIDDVRETGKLREFCTGMIARARMSDEAKEGIEAFLKGREPFWRKEK